MKLLHKRFFRTYAHIYLHHFKEVQEHNVEAQLNHCFKRWMFFVREFNMVDEKDMQPLQRLIHKFVEQAEQEDVLLKGKGIGYNIAKRTAI